MEFHFNEKIERPVSEVFTFYADDHLTNHPRWDPAMELTQTTEGPVEVGTSFDRHHTHFGRPVDGSMRVTRFDRDQSFSLTVDDGFGEWFLHLTFKPDGESATGVSLVADMPHLDDSYDTTRAEEIVERWLGGSKRLLEAGA